MGLFGFNKEKEENKGNKENKGTEAYVKILGSGCDKCNQLKASTVEALGELGMDTEITHVTDFVTIASYGVMSTPALVVGDKVVSYGKVLKKDEVITLLKEADMPL